MEGLTNRKHSSSHIIHHLGGIDKGIDRKKLLKSRHCGHGPRGSLSQDEETENNLKGQVIFELIGYLGG